MALPTLPLQSTLVNLFRQGPLIAEATAARNVRVLMSLLGPAYRGLIQRRGQSEDSTDIQPGGMANFDWKYRREFPAMSRLYEAAKSSQWNGSKDVDWSIPVDMFDPRRKLLPDDFVPVASLPSWRKLTAKERAIRRHSMLSWMLSQFLHGEQGALFAASQVTVAVPWLDAKLFGSTQVVDEGRHVEVFHKYLAEKLEKRYDINDNLYVIVDAIMSTGNWDQKFLGMQIMIEGLALGGFGTLRHMTREPLLQDMLKYVITDEARHVHYGVLALREFYAKEMTDTERRLREDWAFEIVLLMRNRFLAMEIYEEFWGQEMSRGAWVKLVTESPLMSLFRRTMFKRIVPNLKRIGLLSKRIRPRYQALGLLAFENEKDATRLTARDLLKAA